MSSSKKSNIPLASPSIVIHFVRYPRTPSAWLKRDDKLLLAGIASSQSVLEIAEDLQRDHIQVLQRCSDLRLYEHCVGTEEWVEFMGLALAGVPLQVVIDWCTAAESRLPATEIEELAMGDMRGEFALARELDITVVNIDVLADLTWLVSQPADVQVGYTSACQRVVDCFDVLTPATLKSQVLGLTPAPSAWTGNFPDCLNQKGTWSRTDKRRAQAGYSISVSPFAAPKKKRYRRKATAASGATRTIKAKTSRAYKKWTKGSK